MEPQLSVEFVNETDEIVAGSSGWSGGRDSADSDDGCETPTKSTDDADGGCAASTSAGGQKPKPGKKTRGRVKIEMKYIKNKVRRYTTFSKRKTGIMKKAYELSMLTGTQVMLLVASETGHVYTFATRKLHPMITSENGKALIQTCLCTPDHAALDSSSETKSILPMPVLAPLTVNVDTHDAETAQNSAASSASSIAAAAAAATSSVSPAMMNSVSPCITTTHDGVDSNLLHCSQTSDTRDFVDVRSLSTLAGEQYMSSPVAVQLSGAASADVLAAIDLRQSTSSQHQHPTQTMMLIKSTHDQHSASEISFAQMDDTSLQQSIDKQPQCFLYRVPGTNQIVRLQVDPSSVAIGGQILESVATLPDHSAASALTLVNVGGSTGAEDHLASDNSTLFYSMPAALNGLMFATTSHGDTLPTDGYILNIPGTPAFSIPSEHTAGQLIGKPAEHFFTIPLSSQSPPRQQVLASSAVGGFFSASAAAIKPELHHSSPLGISPSLHGHGDGNVAHSKG